MTIDKENSQSNLTNQMVNVVIADDHHLVTETISFFLETNENINIAGTVGSGQELVQLLEVNKNIDLILLDIEMPIMDGVDAAKIVRKKFPKIRIIILSMHAKNEFIQSLVNMGVHGYLLKDNPREVLIHAIQKVMEGDTYFDHRVVKQLIDFSRKHPSGVMLSEREKEVLRLIASEYTNKEISQSLNLSLSTVDFHRKNLYEKTGVKNVAGLTKYALKNGIITL